MGELVDGLNHDKHREGDDDEGENALQEITVGQLGGVLPLAQGDGEAGQIDAARQQREQGVMMSATRLFTMEVNALPMTTPTAMSSTLPRMAKALNSSRNFFMTSASPVLIHFSRAATFCAALSR